MRPQTHIKVQQYIFEGNEAVIKMIIKGRSPTMRHVSGTHRVALDWLFDRINLDPKIHIQYVLAPKKNNSLTCWLKAVSRVMIGVIFFARSTIWIFVCFLVDLAMFSCSLFRQEGRGTCGSESEVSVFDFKQAWTNDNPLHVSNILENPQLDSGSVKGAAENCERDYVQSNMPKNSKGCGKLQRKIEIQPQTIKLDHHNLQVTDHGYVEKVFTRQKLNWTEDDEMFDLKTNILIWRLFMSTTMKSATHLDLEHD